MEKKAEMGVTLPEAKEYLEPLEAGVGKEGSLQPLEGASTFQRSLSTERKFKFKSLSLKQFVTAALENELSGI